MGRFVGLVPGTGGDAVLAMVSWRAAVRALGTGRLSCSDGEACVLRISASIAEGVRVDLSQCLSTLDETNIGPVADAVRHAAAGDMGPGRGERR